ncbi:T9SS type A sorting domain-containing protein [candidate division KSB1 bacterium]|nr:T9SS type A sorting domain-containing protein [candidate division KSB1 bacterium]
MKKGHLLFIILITGIIFLINTKVISQHQFSEIGYVKEDSMSLAVFVLDFKSYEFIEANIAYYPLCDSCDYLGLPFSIDFVSPNDFGSILFKYLYNYDTLFNASIIWMGQGNIDYPEQFIPADSFETTNNHIPLLENAQYYDYWLIPYFYTWTEYTQKADSAWLSIDALQIVNEYADYTYRVGFYAYTPQVGLFNPDVAKWIVFLYYGNDYLTDISDPDLKYSYFEISPNPCYETIRISNYQNFINRPFEIINIQNQVVLSGQIDNEYISVSELNSGLYILKLWTGDEYISKKIIKK